ncbi:hypothetical protein BaRGS_00013362, partial [Batillaria attramentaria]
SGLHRAAPGVLHVQGPFGPLQLADDPSGGLLKGYVSESSRKRQTCFYSVDYQAVTKGVHPRTLSECKGQGTLTMIDLVPCSRGGLEFEMAPVSKLGNNE